MNWDYGWNAAYFVTVCTNKYIHYFGEIENQKMRLSEIGELAEKYWDEIPQHFSFVQLGAFVVMPNHIHGIIIINKTDDTTNMVNTVETPNLGVSTNRTDKNKKEQWNKKTNKPT